MTVTIPALALALTALSIVVGWAISVERRLTKLEGIAVDIHAIRGMLTPLSRLFSVQSLVNVANREHDTP